MKNTNGDHKSSPGEPKQRRSFIAHLPKAVAMLLLGTPSRPTDPIFTLLEGTHSALEGKVRVVPILVSES